MTGDIDYNTFKARYGLYLTDEQVNDLNFVVQSANLQSTKQIEFLVNNISSISAFQNLATTISSDKFSNYLNLLKDNSTFYQFNKLRNFPGVAALALFDFRNIFNIDEFVEVYVNEPLFEQMNKFLNQKGFDNIESKAWVKKHRELINNNIEYADFNKEEGYPIDVDNMVRPYINPENECYCKVVEYQIINNKVKITSNYCEGAGLFSGPSVAVCGHVAIIPKNHPYKAKLQEVLGQIYGLINKPDQDTNAWVYELEGIGKAPDQLQCKSCLPPDKDRHIDLREGETFKFGIAQDKGSFQVSVDVRYPPSQKLIWGILDFNFAGIPRPSANVFAKSYTITSINRIHALLLEKILIFNYILQDEQQPELRKRNIKTTGNLPPGNPIAR